MFATGETVDLAEWIIDDTCPICCIFVLSKCGLPLCQMKINCEKLFSFFVFSLWNISDVSDILYQKWLVDAEIYYLQFFTIIVNHFNFEFYIVLYDMSIMEVLAMK